MNRFSLYFAAALCACAFRVSAGEREQAMAFLTGADVMIAKSNFSGAIDMCNRAISADPTCALAHFKLGECLEKSSKPRDAFKSYQQAGALAKKDDPTLARRAQTAAEKLGKGLLEISLADQKLLDKLLPLADEALEEEQYGIARTAYASILALQPAHEKAKLGLEKAQNALDARGDPIKARLAASMLSEVFYFNGIGDKAKAAKMAQDLTARHADTGPGKEAAELLANNFEPPKNLDVRMAEMKQEIKKINKPKAAAAKPVSSVSSTAPAATAPGAPVDVDATEKLATEEARKLSKDALVSAYKDAYTKGKATFAKATPGSEGNQKNLHEALKHFIHCEQLYLRIDEAKLGTPEIERMQKDASTCRYSCMKMTILGH